MGPDLRLQDDLLDRTSKHDSGACDRVEKLCINNDVDVWWYAVKQMNIKTNIIYYDYSGIFHNKELLKHLKKMWKC